MALNKSRSGIAFQRASRPRRSYAFLLFRRGCISKMFILRGENMPYLFNYHTASFHWLKKTKPNQRAAQNQGVATATFFTGIVAPTQTCLPGLSLPGQLLRIDRILSIVQGLSFSLSLNRIDTRYNSRRARIKISNCVSVS